MNPQQLKWLLFGGILLILILAITIFVLLQIRIRSESPNLPWVIRPLDKLARKNQSCTVLQTFPDSGLEGAVVEIVEDSCEQGLPHTVDESRIRMKEADWTGIRKEDILRHERVHLLQRRYPDVWERFYTEKWGYTLPTSDSTIPNEVAELMRKSRSNPDTADDPYVCWQNRYWFVPVYTNMESPALKDTEVKIWDSQHKIWLSEAPQEWKTFFCGENACPHQWEHPHEISAEIIADKNELTTPARFYLTEFMTQFEQSNLPEK